MINFKVRPEWAQIIRMNFSHPLLNLCSLQYQWHSTSNKSTWTTHCRARQRPWWHSIYLIVVPIPLFASIYLIVVPITLFAPALVNCAITREGDGRKALGCLMYCYWAGCRTPALVLQLHLGLTSRLRWCLYVVGDHITHRQRFLQMLSACRRWAGFAE